VTRSFTLGSVRLAEIDVAPGTDVRPHDHAHAHVCIVTSGSFDERQRKGSQWCTAGWVRYSPGGDRHVMQFGRAGLDCLVVEGMGPIFPSSDGRTYARHRGIAALGARLRDELASPDPSPLVAEALALELFAGATRRAGAREPARRPAWLDRVRDALHDEFRAPPALTELGRIAGRHPLHLTRAFREHFGCSVGSYVRRVQVERARRLLLDSDEPLASVALMAGFADQSHMTRSIRSALGTTPGRLRLRTVAGAA